MEMELIRSARKSLSVEISADCRVIVRAPKRMPERVIREFVASRSEWILKNLERQRQKAERFKEPSPAQVEKIKLAAKRVLGEKLAYWAGIMGVSPSGMKITSAKGRFGSCSAKNRICFSWRLMLYPEDAIDYVVVHELAHILHKNHGAAFHDCVARVLPDHKRRRALLRALPEADYEDFN